MTWSTRRLAEIAGTTVKTVRYYHSVGLLAEPKRALNGYKQYGVEHLVRLLRIKRLTELGVPLSRIAELDEQADPQAMLRALDDELAATIERLHGIRSELAAVLDETTSIDLPAGMEGAGADLTDADRSLLLVYAQMFSPEAMTALRDMLRAQVKTAEDHEFNQLAPDADESTRADLARRYAPQVAQIDEETGWVTRPGPHMTKGVDVAGETIARSIAALYNPAQVDVLVRVNEILNAPPD